MSYYPPYQTYRKTSYPLYSRFPATFPQRYLPEYPEYPPPLYYQTSNPTYLISVPQQTYKYPYSSQTEPTIRNKPLKEPILIAKESGKEFEEKPHGNFFKDPIRNFKTDFEIFINAIKEQIILLRDAEKIKEKLAYTEDFHIDLIYKKFDDNQNKVVSLKEFKEALNNLGVPATEKDSYLVIRQYSKTERLTEQEFGQLFLPRSGFMKNKLLQKDKNKDFIFKQETIEICKELLDIHLRLEISWEKLKQKLQLRKTNLKNLYNFLDSDQNDGFECSDLRQMLEKNTMIPGIWELEFVFHRFDDNNQKQVGFLDFLKELTTTKSPPVIPKLKEFIEIIKKQMEIEKQIEQKKADLIKMKDFDIEKLYKMFDDNESGHVSFQEFKLGIIEKFEVKNPKEEDLVMLFATYNINDDGKLSKNEFKKMIFPSDMQMFQKLIFQPGALTKKNEGSYKFIVGKIFELLLEGEKSWKSAKISFQNREENLKLLFKQMDYDKDDLLKESDFRSFLQETGFMASSSEIHALIRRFDRNGDCHIDLEEFLSELGKQQKIKTIEIDFSDELIALFKGIREFFNKIEKARMALLKRYDFNLSDVLELFDSDKTGQISIKEMNKGLNLFGVEFQDKECYLICMRYSTNKSYFLTYEEFEDLFNPHANIRQRIVLPSRKYLASHKQDKLISHETKQYLNALFLLLGNFEIFWNGIKTTMQQKKFDINKAFKNLDINKDSMIDYNDLENFYKKNDLPIDKIELDYILFLLEPQRTGKIRLETFKFALSPIEKFEEVSKKVTIMEDIADILREIIKVCREIEAFKQAISQREFNQKELFLLLDTNAGGVLTKDELLAGFKRLNIDISDAECRILMREYCVDNDLEIMNFESFRQMFCPLNFINNSKETVNTLQSSRVYNAINKEDLKHIVIFFKNIVQSERKVEKFRQSLIEKKVDLLQIFKVLDSQNDGFLSGEDFIKFIIKSDISSNKTDINLLVTRFDKDKSGTISREEFINELIPTPASFGDKGDDGELLKDVFTEQLIRLRVLEQRKLELLSKKSFRIYELFSFFDENGSGSLTNIELREGLFEIFDINCSWEDVNLLIYKYSKQKDELVLNFDDFKRIFVPILGDFKNSEAFSKPSGKIKREIDEKLRVLIGKFFVYLINYEAFMRILRGELQKKGNLNKLFSLLNVKKTSQISFENFKEFAFKYEISNKEDDVKLLFTIYDRSEKGKLSEQEFISELKPRDLSNLFQNRLENFDYFKVIMKEMKRIFREIEKTREILAEQKDFRLLNLYKMFDLNDSYQISKEEMLRFFKKKGIFINENIVDLILKRYSFDLNGLMAYEEFCMMLMPVSKGKRMERLMDQSKYEYKFEKDTWVVIKKMFQTLSEGERELAILRKNIKTKEIHLEALFRILDRNDKNQVSREYFAEFLQKNQILSYPLDIKCLIKCFDKNNTGFITLKSFLDELKLH